MPVKIQISRRIHRVMRPPLDHAAVRRRIASVASGLLSANLAGSLSLMLCSDRVIQDLNRGWLDTDGPTNVIAFPSPDMASLTDSSGPLSVCPGVLDEISDPDGPPIHLGDIAVSVETARREQRHAGGNRKRIARAELLPDHPADPRSGGGPEHHARA